MSEPLLSILETPCCRDFAEAWNRWRGSAVAPKRADIRLEEIACWLSLLSVLEIRSREEQVFRLVGTQINEARGRELTGTTLKELSRPEDWPARSRVNEAMAVQPCGITFRANFRYSVGEDAVSEYLCLPVFANAPGAPVQLFTIRQPMRNVSMQFPQLDPEKNPVGDDNRFVDIGAGVPDLALLPEPIPPVSLPRLAS
ncbi:MAG: PAS domain-containing protein [Nisaea sp.]|uniref:PAS domain-containing protein n=1 Tax=Nisaea sp. TaxID=2024842 RepID=UPI001B21F3E4|nr:PAS domain-containing protein [Nisaea sp.]MBO6560792.1 PAS domain-containing protein [Nisaea sp.]